jgi:peptidyl-prolyl cis-trans isomerase C
MGISVNGIEITDAAIEQELPHHRQAANPLKQSVQELVLRTVLLQEADRLGIAAEDDDARVEALFEQEVHVPQADDAACETFYRNQPQRFTNGELVEARHILFQVTPSVPLELLRVTGEAVLAELRANPDRFAELAKEYSNCSSGAVGGNLGQLTRGQTVPEFEALVFRLGDGEMVDRLLETRFGLHIVQAMRRTEGTLLPFEAVKAQIADNLRRQAWQRAVHQYMQILVGRSDIQGVTLEGAASPLVQ